MVAKNLQRILGGAILAGTLLGNASCSNRYMSIHDRKDETIINYQGKQLVVVDTDLGPLVEGYLKSVRADGERRAIIVEPLTAEENKEIRDYLKANRLAGF